MKTKIQKYFKLQRQIDSLDKKTKELHDAQDNIFCSRFKTCEKYCNGTAIFEVFLNNPDKAFDVWQLKNRISGYWSDESMSRNIKGIIKDITC